MYNERIKMKKKIRVENEALAMVKVVPDLVSNFFPLDTIEHLHSKNKHKRKGKRR